MFLVVFLLSPGQGSLAGCSDRRTPLWRTGLCRQGGCTSEPPAYAQGPGDLELGRLQPEVWGLEPRGPMVGVFTQHPAALGPREPCSGSSVSLAEPESQPRQSPGPPGRLSPGAPPWPQLTGHHASGGRMVCSTEPCTQVSTSKTHSHTRNDIPPTTWAPSHSQTEDKLTILLCGRENNYS